MITLLILRGCMHFNGFLSGGEGGGMGLLRILATFHPPSGVHSALHYDSLDGKFFFIIFMRVNGFTERCQV